MACESCCKKISNTCPSCTKSIGSIRCRAIENVVQSAKFPCVNKQYGCTEKLCYFNKDTHEKKQCKYAPVACPCCEYVNEFKCIYEHFAEHHPSSAKHITLNKFVPLVVDNDATHLVLQERGEKILFVLNRFTDPHGSLINVTCVAPTTSDVKFSYLITAKTENSKISLKDLVELTPKLIALPLEKNCLLITKDFHHINVSKRCFLKASLKITKVS